MRNTDRSRLNDEYQFVNAFAELPLFAHLTEKSVVEAPAEAVDIEAEMSAEDDPADGTLTGLDNRILALLCDRPREQAILGPELCRSVGIAPTPNGQRRLRTTVARLVDLGYPLGTARTGQHRGFYWLIRPEDRKTAAAHLRHQAFKILRRADKLEKSSAAAEHRGQLRLAG